jgi:glycosyltransferase involved in cell wall biosynthesis
MKIGFITCHFPPDSIGGGQVQSYKLCKELGKSVYVKVFIRDYSGKMPNNDVGENFFILRRKTLNIPFLRSIVDLIKGLKQIYQNKKDLDIFISFHIQLAALIVVLSRILFDVKAVVSPRGEEDFDFKLYKKSFQKFIYKHTTAVLIQSEIIKDKFLNNASQVFSNSDIEKIKIKIVLFPNGIELEDKIADNSGNIKKDIIFVGRLAECKGINFLIEAFKHLGKSYKLTIVGAGPEKEKLQNMSKGLNVNFAGEIEFNEVREYIKDSGVLVLPSLTENLPNVLLEALSCGIPVVATNVGAIPQLIQDGINGYLVEPGNSAQIAEKIKTIFTNTDKYHRMCIEALETVRPYSWESQRSELISKLEIIAK